MKVVNTKFILLIAAAFNIVSINGLWEQAVAVSDGTVETYNFTTEPENLISTEDELAEDVIFHLYTISNPNISEQIYVDDYNVLNASNFNSSKQTRIIIHGWRNQGNSTMCTSLRDAYLTVGDYNIIVVDWNAYAVKNYLYARQKIFTVGTYVAKMIDFLVDYGMVYDNLIIAGHSLGAHTSGIAARYAKKIVVPFVIAMDPAGPLFYFYDTLAKLQATDAEHVHVIHTSAARLGYEGTLGTIDYWVNGGSIQPGCGLDMLAECAHSRSYLYVAESITATSTKFIARTCSTYTFYRLGLCSSTDSTYMGGDYLNPNVAGKYYVLTNSASPFAEG